MNGVPDTRIPSQKILTRPGATGPAVRSVNKPVIAPAQQARKQARRAGAGRGHSGRAGNR